MPPYTPFQPGQPPTSTQLQMLWDTMLAQQNPTGGGPSSAAFSSLGLETTDFTRPPMAARIVGNPIGNAYGWTQVNDADPELPEPGPDGIYVYQSGEADNTPAYEVTGRTDVPDGTPVKLWSSPNGDFWYFWFDGTGDGEGSGAVGCCAEGDPPIDDGECPEQPFPCVVWYSNYQHLESVAVREGQNISPGQLIGYIGRYYTGAHSHFSIGGGPPELAIDPPRVIGQSIDIASWLGYPTQGTRYTGTSPLMTPPFDADQLTYLESVFLSPLANAPVIGSGWKIFYGSQAHDAGEFYAVDLFPADADPYNQDPADQSMAGTPINNAVAEGAEVESTVVAVTYINDVVHTMVTVRHRRKCCPVDGGTDPTPGGSGSGSGSGTGGNVDGPYPPPNEIPQPATVVNVATGKICFTGPTGSGSGSGTGADGLGDAVSEAIANWVIAQVANGSWDGTPFPLVATIQTAQLSALGLQVTQTGCTTLSDECDTLCVNGGDCDTACVEDCSEAPDGAPQQWEFYSEITVAGGMTTLVYTAACEWTGTWTTPLFSQSIVLYHDGSGFVLQSPADGTGAVYEPGDWTPLFGGSWVLANPDDPGIGDTYPDSLILDPACTPDCIPSPAECAVPESLCVTITGFTYGGTPYGDASYDLPALTPTDGSDWAFGDALDYADFTLNLYIFSQAGVVKVRSAISPCSQDFNASTFTCDPFAATVNVNVSEACDTNYSYTATFAEGPCPLPPVSSCGRVCDAGDVTVTESVVYVCDASTWGQFRLYDFTPDSTGTYRIDFTSLNGYSRFFRIYTENCAGGSILANGSTTSTGCISASLTGGVHYYIYTVSGEGSDPGTDGYSFHVESGAC